MVWSLFLLPLVAGLLAFFVRANLWRRSLLVGTAVVHLVLVSLSWLRLPDPTLFGWLTLDEMGRLFLSLASILFLAAAVYAVGYLNAEPVGKHEDNEERGGLFVNEPEAIFTGCLLVFLATMTLVTVSQHLGLLWVAVEATTLASAPLVYFHRQHRSLEATWKYLVICSVGIALALLGNFLLAIASNYNYLSQESGSLVLGQLIKDALNMNGQWLQAAFIFLLVGYGTKMGLAPLHTWLPDAHSEAPSLVSALLSGALLNCAFLAILRAYQVCLAAGLADFCRHLLLGFGLFSLVLAAVFVVGQTDYKRLLAYSSVEHMGILALGVGLGGQAVFGSMLHAVNHSLTKAMLFLLAGNILAVYQTKTAADVGGVCRVLRTTGPLWIIGFLAICGSPPFGAFISEFTIIKAACVGGYYWVAMLFLALLAVIFIGMGSVMLRMAQGPASLADKKESYWQILPPAILVALVLMLGLYIPNFLYRSLSIVALAVGGDL